jgi:hypothetical protein
MSVRFQNFDYSYEKNGKWIFVPSALGREIGNDLKQRVEQSITFEDFYYHLQPGGHVGALHQHRNNQYFARLDISNFFYNISRSRLDRGLKECGIDKHTHYAKWSTVKNPYLAAGYAVPFGFVQSPILASLILKYSTLGKALTTLAGELTVSVFVDDIAVSSNSLEVATNGFNRLESSLIASGFSSNARKRREPSRKIEIFNCALAHNFAEVSEARISLFDSLERSVESKQAFKEYCEKIAAGNRI